jgi:hypothetical protein
MCVLILQFLVHPDVVKSIGTKELIHKANSDNTDLFCNFIDSVGVIPLTCNVHSSGAVVNLILPSVSDISSATAIPYNTG